MAAVCHPVTFEHASMSQSPHATRHRSGSDWPFFWTLGGLSATYIVLIVALLAAIATFTTPAHLLHALDSPEIRYSAELSLFSCTVTTLLSLWVAVPTGYLMSRAAVSRASGSSTPCSTSPSCCRRW